MRYYQGDNYDELRLKLEEDYDDVEIRYGNDRDLFISGQEKISRTPYYGKGYINQLPHKEIWRANLEEV